MEVSSWENHLFRLGPSIPWRTVSHNQRVCPGFSCTFSPQKSPRSPASNGQSIVHQFFHGRLLLLIAILQEINQVLSMIPGSFLGVQDAVVGFILGYGKPWCFLTCLLPSNIAESCKGSFHPITRGWRTWVITPQGHQLGTWVLIPHFYWLVDYWNRSWTQWKWFWKMPPYWAWQCFLRKFTLALWSHGDTSASRVAISLKPAAHRGGIGGSNG